MSLKIIDLKATISELEDAIIVCHQEIEEESEQLLTEQLLTEKLLTENANPKAESTQLKCENLKSLRMLKRA